MITYVRGFGYRFTLVREDEERRDVYPRVLHHQRFRSFPPVYGFPITNLFDTIAYDLIPTRYALVPIRASR